MSVHGFQRFLDTHEYRSNVPIQNLFFEVTVHRALVVEESEKTLIAKEVIPWGTKLPSLAETLYDYQHMVARRSAMARVIVANGGEPSQLSESVLEEEDPHGMAAYRLVTEAEGSNAYEKMANVCQTGSAMLFTRPPAEDYIPLHDEVNVVDPPQPPTPLTIAMLRDHRIRNLPSTKMHFGIALGTVRSGFRGPGGARGPKRRSDTTDKKINRSGGGSTGDKSGGGSTADAPSEAPTAAPPRNDVSDEVEMLHTNAAGEVVSFEEVAGSLDGYGFDGEEIILASIDNVAENEMRCKPSLVDEHTCYVDAQYIYTFTITITDKDPTKPNSPPRAPSIAGPGMGGVARSALMVRQFANMMKNTLRASRRFLDSGGGGGMFMQSQAKEDRDRQILLKQAIMNRMQQQKVAGAASISAAAKYGVSSSTAKLNSNIGGLSAGSAKDAATFTPAPEFTGMTHLHVMGVIENAYNIPQDSLFVRYRFILPDGCTEDTAENIKAGLSPSLAGPVTSQLAWAARIRDEDFVYRTMHTFNQPLELHATLPINSATPIRLVMSFYAKGSGGDYYQTAEGYGQQTIPMFAGSYNFEVLLWRPKPTAFEYMKSVFIGGAPSLADDEDIGIPAHVMDGCYSRAGLQTESTGWVRLKINIISHVKPEGDVNDRFLKKALERR